MGVKQNKYHYKSMQDYYSIHKQTNSGMIDSFAIIFVFMFWLQQKILFVELSSIKDTRMRFKSGRFEAAFVAEKKMEAPKKMR
jgi:hypothetical protein